MNHRGTEAQRINRVTEEIIGCGIEVHRGLGPGLLESAYEECLCYELSHVGLTYQRQVDLPVIYKGIRLDCGYRMDLIVEESVVIELKTVEALVPIHQAQLLTYLKLSGYPVGLLMNFNAPTLMKGLKRFVHKNGPFSAPQRLCGESKCVDS